LGRGQKSGDSNKSSKAVKLLITQSVKNITATIDQKERRIKSKKKGGSKVIPIYKKLNSLFVESKKKCRNQNEE
jgi:hypothetical protein